MLHVRASIELLGVTRTKFVLSGIPLRIYLNLKCLNRPYMAQNMIIEDPKLETPH